jgi:beta-glucosidase
MNFLRTTLGTLAILSSITVWAAQQAGPPSTRFGGWMNRSLPPRQRAELLVKQMTLDEKILEIHMMNTRAHPREVPAIPRLGIPALKITNGPAGAGPGDSPQHEPATALPSALGLAASWDPTLARTFGRIAASESADRGERVLEAPGLNITRVPQNGRNFEYFGEDPYLAARMGVAEILGIQQEGVMAEAKHYDANNQEADRKTINEVIGERTLREIYMPAFEAAVKEGHTASIMCAYPSVNGEFGCENVHQLKDVLRGGWGFKGFVQSDYTATHSTIPAALAGLDLEMKHDEYYDGGMKAAVTKGKLRESVVDEMLVRRFSEMFRFGLFDHAPQTKPIPAKQDGAIARSIAEQSAVLLKNNKGLLPLRATAIHSIALVGPYAGAAMTGGGGSSEVTPIYTVSPVEGIKKAAGPNVIVSYNDGSDPAAAAKTAASADVALVMVGNKDREGHDRANLLLPGGQDQLVEAVAAANSRTVVILKTGGPVLMPWLSKVGAVLEAWYPGEEDGDAVAALLFGEANPSGKLPMTFPKADDETPAHTPQQYPGVNGTVVYSEGLDVGYRWYDAKQVAPLFPFGYGLSYTTFSFSHISVPRQTEPREQISVSLDITNTGSRSGADVVQVYVADPPAAGEPPRQLRGFQKVDLPPHQTRHATIKLDPRAFSIWNTSAKQWTVVPGQYEILAGDSSHDLPLHITVRVGKPASPSTQGHSPLQPFQKINHLPGSGQQPG